jgi:hypothetical protein
MKFDVISPGELETPQKQSMLKTFNKSGKKYP